MKLVQFLITLIAILEEMDAIVEGRTGSESLLLNSTQQHIKTLISFAPEESPNLTEAGLYAELSEAKKRFSPIYEAVGLRYKGLPGELLPNYLAHNEEVLTSVVFFNNLFNLDKRQRRITEAAAIGHDIAKADPPQDKTPTHYTLLKHPELGADIVTTILKGQSDEFWDGIDGEVANHDDFIAQVAQTIRTHSGPIPGFMANTLTEYNAKAKNLGVGEVTLPLIDPNHIPSVVLLISDMLGLGTPSGIRKIAAIRQSDPVYRAQDVTAAIGANVPLYEMHVENALTSAYQGAEMVQATMLQNDHLQPHVENVYGLMRSYFNAAKTYITKTPT